MKPVVVIYEMGRKRLLDIVRYTEDQFEASLARWNEGWTQGVSNDLTTGCIEMNHLGGLRFFWSYKDEGNGTGIVSAGYDPGGNDPFEAQYTIFVYTGLSPKVERERLYKGSPEARVTERPLLVMLFNEALARKHGARKIRDGNNRLGYMTDPLSLGIVEANGIAIVAAHKTIQKHKQEKLNVPPPDY